MAKLGLLFVAVFCIVQLSLAARIPRETETTTKSFLDTAQESFGEFAGQFQETLAKTFTKENSDKLLQTIKEGADSFSEKAKGLASDFSDKLSEISKDLQKEPEKKP